MHYNFIHDIAELRLFFDLIVPELKDFEVYFISLSCRNKYLTDDEREKYHITRAEMFDRKIVRKREWIRFLRSIKKYESIEGSYVSKNGMSIPQKCMVIYYNINPSNSLRALSEFQAKMAKYQYEIMMGGSESYIPKMNKLDIEIMNCYQRNRGTKHWIDIDFDVPKELNFPEIMKEYLLGLSIRFYWIDTKSGYHLLIDKNTLSFNPKIICTYGLDELFKYFNSIAKYKDLYPITSAEEYVSTGENIYEIVLNKNEMIPMPGTLQGGYPVKVLWDYS